MVHSLSAQPGAPSATSEVRHCEWRLPAVPASIPEMRRGLRGLLVDSSLSYGDAEDLLLAASEAANNAVEHAQQPREPFFDVCTEVDDGQVTIVIHDHGGWRQQTFPTDRGRGLAMMRVLAETTITTRPDGTTVTIRSRSDGPGAMTDAGGTS